ncbi:MAG: transketolase family protein [Candidatus Tectomicrobia bacterium]|nr:transketolase family protein [Candidatus Tectomicrobia bacterium]
MGGATRDAYGKTLVELGEENPDIVVLDADLSESTRTKKFAEKFPERFFNMGIAEAHMVSTAAGLASCGKIPFISSFAVFMMCKGFDQLRMCVAYPGLNVKVVASHGGISIGEDGPSQQSVEDLALACALAGFRVAAPADPWATRCLVRQAAEIRGPVYIRVGRPPAPILYSDKDKIEFGRATVHGLGRDVTVLTNGLLVAEALKASDLARQEGLDLGVVDVHTLKPLDVEKVEEAARASGALVVAEEHLLAGGLCSQVAMAAANSRPVPIEFVGLQDTYAESGKPMELLEKYGLTAASILRAAERAAQRKDAGRPRRLNRAPGDKRRLSPPNARPRRGRALRPAKQP